MSSILHHLPLSYTLFTCLDPDPYSEYGSESTKVPNTDPIWIRIHDTVPEKGPLLVEQAEPLLVRQQALQVALQALLIQG